MPGTYAITTLGCRVNHAEAREIEAVLRSRGLSPAGEEDPPDLVVVHTCSVTNTAAAKSRQAVRRALRNPVPPNGEAICQSDQHPAIAPTPAILVTGCFVTTNPAEAEQLTGGRGSTIPHDTGDGSTMVDRFAGSLDAWLAGISQDPVRTIPRPSSEQTAILPLPVVEPTASAAKHIRAELRIQDGCDAHCTFCIIPKIRRTLRSKTPADAVREARRLVELGHKEIVLAGIFIGAYGHETALRRKQRNRHTHPLADLLDAVAQVNGVERLRISSMEPGDVDERLLDAMVANAPVVVPHLHLPLQSGSDAVLRRMNRQYGVDDYLQMIEMVESALTVDGLPPAITTDVICGFPGETDDDFARTVAIAEHVGYLHMHVFPYSTREGTAAARWRDQYVPDAEKRRRVRTLIDMEEEPTDGLSIRYRRRLLGRTIRMIVEQPHKTKPGVMTGRCDHYALIDVETDAPRGTLMRVRVSEVDAERTVGVPVAGAVSLPVLPASG